MPQLSQVIIKCINCRSPGTKMLRWDLLGIVVQPGPAGLAVKPLDLHMVNVGSIPTGPTHGEGRLQPHPGDVLKSTPKVWKSPRSGLNVEGRLSDHHFFFASGPAMVATFNCFHHGYCSLASPYCPKLRRS